MTEKERRELLWIKLVCYSIVGYIGIAYTVYAYRNPKLTKTQLALHMWEIVTWQGPEKGGGR